MLSIFTFLASLLIETGAFSFTCAEVPLYLKMKNNSEYTYTNVITLATWPKGMETEKNIKRKNGGFQTISVPISLDPDQAYTMMEVNIKTDDASLLQILGKNPDKLPYQTFMPIYPLGFKSRDENSKPQPIKIVKCNEVFKTKTTVELNELQTTLTKESINQVVAVNEIKIAGKRNEVIHIETRTKVVLSGFMEGTGIETEAKILLASTRELLKNIVTFEYNYRIGEAGQRYDESMRGKFIKTIEKQRRYLPINFSFLEKTKGKVNYFSDKNGIFIPVYINTTLKTNMHIDTASQSSVIGYPYYISNVKYDPKNYFIPFESLNIGGNILSNPPFKIEYSATEKEFDYKIPGKIAGDLLSLGVLEINDKKRELAFYKSDKNKKIPDKAILFKHTDNVPVFNALVNSSQVKTTLATDCYTPEMSYTLKEQLGLKTRKLLKDNVVVEKADIILTPPNSAYTKTEVNIKDFRNAPYDLKLCLDYIKDKLVTINYDGKWILIKSASKKSK